MRFQLNVLVFLIKLRDKKYFEDSNGKKSNLKKIYYIISFLILC